MEHIRSIIQEPHLGPPRSRGPSVPISWRAAAEEAHALAAAQAVDPATLKQLRRVCQLLTSRTVRERERRRAFLRLARGCSKRQASAMLDYFIPEVRARTTRK